MPDHKNKPLGEKGDSMTEPTSSAARAPDTLTTFINRLDAGKQEQAITFFNETLHVLSIQDERSLPKSLRTALSQLQENQAHNHSQAVEMRA